MTARDRFQKIADKDCYAIEIIGGIKYIHLYCYHYNSDYPASRVEGTFCMERLDVFLAQEDRKEYTNRMWETTKEYQYDYDSYAKIMKDFDKGWKGIKPMSYDSLTMDTPTGLYIEE